MEVIDSLENKNYSFTLTPKIPKPNSIFNLVVNSSNGNTNMAILEYRMAPNFALDYHDGTKTFSEFTGSIFKFPFNPSTTNFAKSSTTCVQNIDEIVNCNQINVDNGGITSSGGEPSTTLADLNTYTGVDGGSTNYNYDGGSGGTVSWVCDDDGTSQWSPSECDGAGHGGTWIVRLPPPSKSLNKSSNYSKTDNCCDDTNIDGSVGVNILINQLKLQFKATLSTEQLAWLEDGNVYDFDNLFIVTPRYHKEILLPEYHFGYGY